MNIEPNAHRKFPRIHFDRQVKLDFSHDRYYTKVDNLSLTGVFLIGNFQEHDGKYCLIDLYQTEKSVDLNLSLRASAKVVWKNDKGIAVEFIAMPFESYMFLQSTLGYDLEMPLAVRQELAANYPYKITDDVSTSLETNNHSNN